MCVSHFVICVPLAYNIPTYFPQPNLSYFPPPLTSYAPSSGASGAPSPEAIVPASQPSAGPGYAPPGPLLTSNALNRRTSSSTCLAVLEPPASIASIPDLDRRRGKGGWRQAISQWENVDPQTGYALKDWPRHWYTGDSQVKLCVKRGYRKSVALEYKRLGGTEQQFLDAHPEADTITFLKLVKKINVQNGSVGRASKNGPPDARLQSS
ncbi:hypothetical protein Hypma_001163 [Hypsizygus marmoreus]|uniref:Uncharacterized protein n=1 Tax=Hypsizygus marmoreus TaxID=39966 RepID=A0A369JA99_HYPMA|nr:hypothetical protein Hypma_001163 [Hypsizygus marmoreus]